MRWDQYPYIIPTEADMLLTSAGLDLVIQPVAFHIGQLHLSLLFLGAAGVIIFLVHKCRQKEKKT